MSKPLSRRLPDFYLSGRFVDINLLNTLSKGDELLMQQNLLEYEFQVGREPD